MAFVFEKQDNKQPEPETVTIPLEEYNELKLAMQYIEDNKHTVQFMMYTGLLSSPQDNLDTEDDNSIFIEVD